MRMSLDLHKKEDIMAEYEPTVELTLNTKVASLVEAIDIDYMAEYLSEDTKLDWIGNLTEGIPWQTVLSRLLVDPEDLKAFLYTITKFDYEMAANVIMTIAKSSTKDERKELVWQIAKI